MISQSQFAKAIGHGRSKLSIVSSGILASTLFFYTFILGSIFKIPIFIIEDRLTNNTFFTDVYVISRNVDQVVIASGTLLWLILSIKGKARAIASAIYALLCISAFLISNEILTNFTILVSIPIIFTFLIYNRISSKKILNVYAGLAINYFAIICTALGILSIVLSSVLIYSSQLTAMPVRNYAYMIYLLASSASTVMMFLLVFCVPLKFLMNEIEKAISKFKQGIFAEATAHSLNKKPLRIRIFYLSLIACLSIALTIIPHQPTLSKDSHYIGSDTADYVSMLNGLRNASSPDQFFQRAFVTITQGDRPLSLIFLYTVAKISPGDIGHTIDYVPIILGPLLVITVYFLTREITSNESIGILASFLTATSFHTLIGIYAGFYANWLALVIGYLSFVFLFRYLKKAGKWNAISYGILLVLLLFTHVYTWSLLALVAGIFLAVMLKLNFYPKNTVFLLLLITLSSVVVDFARTYSTGSYTGIASDIKIANTYGFGVGQFLSRWDNLDDSVHGHFGAMFGNFIILALGLYWFLYCKFCHPSTIILAIFLSMAIIPISVGDWIVQTRVLYEIPFQIPAAIALGYILTRPNGVAIFLPLCIWLIGIAMIDVTNF